MFIQQLSGTFSMRFFYESFSYLYTNVLIHISFISFVRLRLVKHLKSFFLNLNHYISRMIPIVHLQGQIYEKDWMKIGLLIVDVHMSLLENTYIK